MVIAVHTSTYFSDLPAVLSSLVREGARGVQLFFVASALTLCLSWQTRNDGALPFFIRRLFRIAPMFWLAIVYFVATRGMGPSLFAPGGTDGHHILLTASFLHGLFPDSIANVVPGGWSIADEMMFYLIFPALFVMMNSLSLRAVVLRVAAFTAMAILISRAVGYYQNFLSGTDADMWGVFVDLWFPRQFPCFLFGILVFKVSTVMPAPSRRLAVVLVLSAIVSCFALPYLAQIKYAVPLGMQVTYGFWFAVLAYGLMHWQPMALVNPVIGYVGKISFSAYLVHFALISRIPKITPFDYQPLNLAFMLVVVVGLTALISTVTYLVIERPMIALGNRVVAMLLSSPTCATARQQHAA